LGGKILSHSNETARQFDTKSLDLALLALKELAKRKSLKKTTYDREDILKFCEAIISKNDDLQVELIETLIRRGISLDTIYETFIPEVAESLGNLWKENKVTFVEVNIGAQRLHRLSRIYEKQYLGPMYLFSEGPDILLILPEQEVHTLGLITASGIFKKNGANPFIAVGYSDEEIIELIELRSFKLIGMSVSNSDNLENCLKTAKNIKKHVKENIPMVAGGQGVNEYSNPELFEVFDRITTNPNEALELIEEQPYN
jgi:methanogenic corrinoid protein MtbC1